jgi:hypothetical protein
MKPANVERNKKIHDLWLLGQTIDQISMVTGIPRSTVGYYVRKFKRTGQGSGIQRSITPQSSPDISTSESILMKTIFFSKVLELVKDGDFERLYYFLHSYKMLMQMQSYIKLTEDEQKLLQEAMSEFKEKMDVGAESTRRGKTIKEIVDEASSLRGLSEDSRL